jgi:uncharacterized membrane protein YfcA
VSGLEVAAGACVVAGALVQSATGFGFSLLAAPLAYAAFDPKPAVGLLLLLGAEVNLMTLGTEGRRPEPLKRETILILVCAVPGALGGVALLRALSALALQIAVTVGVLATLAVRHIGRGRAHFPAWAAGITAGALTTTTSTNGPPLVLHLLGLGAPPARVRDTLPTCMLGLAAIGGVALAATGTPALPDAGVIVAFVPLVAIGHLVGRRLFAHLAESEHFEAVLNGLLLVAVVAGLVGVLVD